MKCKPSDEEVVPKLRDVVDHAEGFVFHCGVILFSGRESSANVVKWTIPVWQCPLHESAANSHIRRIHKNVEWLGPVRQLYHRACDNITLRDR